MFRVLGIGDPHIRPEDVGEGKALVGLALELAEKAKPDAILLFGDLFHYHEVMDLRVLAFWRDATQALSARSKVIVLKGNHDRPHDVAADVNAIWPLFENSRIWPVDEGAFEFGPGLLAVPYCATEEEFLAECAGKPKAAAVYCHQTFDGAMFENGMYAPDGFDPSKVPQEKIISGHIHRPQEFGKVIYAGSPRWLTAGDANQDRFILIFDHSEEDGRLVKHERFPTDKACRRMVQIDDLESAPADPSKIDPAWRATVDIRGSEAWVKERKAAWSGIARVRAHPERARTAAIKESEGVPQSFKKYAGAYQPPNKTPKEVLMKMASERLPVFFG